MASGVVEIQKSRTPLHFGHVLGADSPLFVEPGRFERLIEILQETKKFLDFACVEIFPIALEGTQREIIETLSSSLLTGEPPQLDIARTVEETVHNGGIGSIEISIPARRYEVNGTAHGVLDLSAEIELFTRRSRSAAVMPTDVR